MCRYTPYQRCCFERERLRRLYRKNKWEMEKLLGKKKFKEIRRGWDASIPNGESLKMVYERSVPYFLKDILPLLKQGKNVWSLLMEIPFDRIIKYIEKISDAGIADVEMPFGAILIYDLDDEGYLVHKETRQLKSEVSGVRYLK